MNYRFGNCVLDTARFGLYRDGRKVEIQPQVFRLLAHLIENRDRVVPRDELHDKIFGRRVVTDNALTVRIREARSAVGDSGATQSVIATIPGVGYRFVTDVETLPHVAPGTDDSRAATDPLSAAADPPLTQLPLSSQPLVAVLPFDVIGSTECDDTIARGLVHDVITRIARSRTMLVIARGTSFQFPSGAQDVGVVGSRLGVKYVVQGAVQQAGKKIRISVGLASALTQQELWTWTYDRRLDDVFLVQDEIATTIVGALESEIQRIEMQLSSLIPSSNLDAWSAYHRGLNHMYGFRSKDCDEAEKYFRRAIDLDRDVPRPYAGLSFVAYERAYLDLEKERSSNLRKAFDFASHAINIDPMDPMGYWALSRANLLDGQLETARQAIGRATELNPSYATAQYFRGWIAMQSGDHETCVERIDLARRLSPCDPLIYGMLGVSALALALMDEGDEAIRRATDALLHPGVHYQARAIAAVIFSLAGDQDKARENLEQVKQVNPDYDLDEFFSVYHFQEEDDVRRIRNAFERIVKRIRH